MANVGLAALGALPPDSVVTEAPGWTAQPSRTLQSLGGLQRQPCDNPARLDLGGGVSESEVFPSVYLSIRHTDRSNMRGKC